MANFSKYGAQSVLKAVDYYIETGDKFRIRDVCDDLNIFDWWPEILTQTHLKDMRKFLKEAIKLGYTGYVCFKVGATGCANGMWATKAESTDGYTPDGDALYKSFTPAYNYWQIHNNGFWLPMSDEYDSLTTIKKLEKFIEDAKQDAYLCDLMCGCPED